MTARFTRRSFCFAFLGIVLLASVVSRVLAQQDAQENHPSRRDRKKGANPDDQKHEINVDGTKRAYLLYVPHSAPKNRALPLLFVFHGGGGHDSNMPRFTGFDEIAESRSFLVVYPKSVNGHWNDGRNLSPADDVGFVRVLIAELKRSYQVDAARIYATGISNGGFFSQRLACDLADQIVAVASVAATIPEPLVPICPRSRSASCLFKAQTILWCTSKAEL